MFWHKWIYQTYNLFEREIFTRIINEEILDFFAFENTSSKYKRVMQVSKKVQHMLKLIKTTFTSKFEHNTENYNLENVTHKYFEYKYWSNCYSTYLFKSTNFTWMLQNLDLVNLKNLIYFGFRVSLSFW